MENTIKVKIVSTYGMERIYPACDTSRQFATIAGTKTLSKSNIKIIKSLGYSVEVVSPEKPIYL